jgi:autotransporter passenger strand-loop-strand repeat protein
MYVYSGGTEVISAGGTAADTTVTYGGAIDLNFLAYAPGATASVNSSTDVFTVSAGSNTYTQQLAGDYAGLQCVVTPDGSGGTCITLTDEPPEPPTISGTASGQTTTDTALIYPFSNVTITDSNPSQIETLRVTMSDPTNGAWWIADLGLYGGLGVSSENFGIPGVIIATGTAAGVTAFLQNLAFEPTIPPQGTSGQPVTTTFTITDTDTFGLSASDGTTTVVASGDPTMQFIDSEAAGETLVATPQAPDDFVFNCFTHGTHTITGFNPAQDLITLRNPWLTSYAAVEAATSAVGGGTMIALGNGGSLLLPGVNPTALHASNFVVT